MAAPLGGIWFPPSKHFREIDNHYHLQLVAANTDEIVQYQDRAFRLQQKAAVQNLRAAAEAGSRQDKTNALIEELNAKAQELVGATNAQTDILREGFGQLNATAEELLDAVNVQTEVLRQGFETVARLMIEQQRTLLELTQVLRNPYETKAQELLREAERALKDGTRASGRDQQEHFKEALRLFTEVLNNPIGSRDYVAWFHLGWLKWKFQDNLTEAADAFYHAGRLSAARDIEYSTLILEGYSGRLSAKDVIIDAISELTGRGREDIHRWLMDAVLAELGEKYGKDVENPRAAPMVIKEGVAKPAAEEIANRLKKLGGTVSVTPSPTRKNPFYAEGVWHHAYMQDLLCQSQDAYDTVQKAITATPEHHGMVFDAARYATKTGRTKEALELVEKCIDLRPETIVTMFDEPDFGSMKPQLLALLTRRTQQARENAERDLRQLLASIEVVRQSGTMADYAIKLPADVTENIGQRLTRLRLRTYVALVAESARARRRREAIIPTAQQQMTEEIQNRKRESDSLQAEFDKLKADTDRQRAALESEAKAVKRLARFEEEHVHVEDWDSSLYAAYVAALLTLGRHEAAVKGALSNRSFDSTNQYYRFPLGFFKYPRAKSARDRELQEIGEEISHALSKLERKLSTEESELEKPLSAAKAREKKARAALALLQAQTSVSD